MAYLLSDTSRLELLRNVLRSPVTLLREQFVETCRHIKERQLEPLPAPEDMKAVGEPPGEE